MFNFTQRRKCVSARSLLPFLLALLALLSVLAPAANCVAADRPNIVLIMVDDMGFSDIGPYGSEIPTPHLDALAARGAKFSQFYNTGRCCPTRASLLTGLYSHQAGVGWMTEDQGVDGYRGQLNDRCVTIAEVLGQAGYFTAMTGKWHVGFNHGVTPAGRGFDRSLNLPAGGLHFSDQTGPKGGTKMFLNGEEVARDDPRFSPPWYGSNLWTEQGIRFVDEAIARDRPFFWYLAHVAPHFPCMAPEATIAKYRGKYKAGWDRLREQRYARQIAAGLIDKGWQLEPRPDEVPAWDSLSAEEQTRYDDMMAIYAAMIEEVDKNIGKLVEALRERGQLDNTLILFLSDNGGNAEAGVMGKYVGEHPGDPHSDVFIGRCWAHLNNTPFRKYKHYNHEGGIASPLIAHWPAAIKPREGWIDSPAHLIDIMATCVDLAETKYPSEFKGRPIVPAQGRSLKPLLTGDRSAAATFASRTLYWEHEGNAAIRVGDRKLVRQGLRGTWELFDLKSDRTEQQDLAGEHPEEAATLAKQWRQWAQAANVLPRPANRAKQGKGKAKQQGKKQGKKKQPASEPASGT
ncbi:MAG: arylsulfatase [Planctomycetales bacterium]|nr:arylsulfatase [Planctomycetales bacterium]